MDHQQSPANPPATVRRRTWKRRIKTLCVLMGIYFVVMACAPVADMLLLHPNNGSADAAGAQRRALAFQSGELEVWVERSPAAQSREPEAFVLGFVGNAARAEYLAAPEAWQWQDKPVEVWAVNWPGYGGSTGPARLSKLAPAGLAAYDELARVANGRPIYVHGTSLGTAVALHVAANRKVAGVILQNPPPLRALILGRFGWWNLWLAAGPVALQVPADLDSIENARRCTAPGVYFTCENDTLVPPDYQRRIVDAHAGPKRHVILRNADHNTPACTQADDYRQAIQWLWAR